MKSKKEFIFSKANYKLMLIGFVVIALGFILMVGGGSDDPNIFNPSKEEMVARKLCTNIYGKCIK